jgi:hypothetical protein
MAAHGRSQPEREGGHHGDEGDRRDAQCGVEYRKGQQDLADDDAGDEAQ